MIDYMSANNLLEAIIPISRFNRGEANRIFEEVSSSGFKVVVKNNKPACVLVAPEKYQELVEMLENYALYMEAEKRISEATGSKTILHQEILHDLGIGQEELAAIDVELEL